MKAKAINIFLVLFFVLFDFVVFAQPGNDDENGCLDCDDTPAAPINKQLIWLAIAGIAFAIYTYRKHKRIV